MITLYKKFFYDTSKYRKNNNSSFDIQIRFKFLIFYCYNPPP